MASVEEFTKTFDSIKTRYNESSQLINEAIELESNDPKIALEKFKAAIELIDLALSTPVALPTTDDIVIDQKWNLCKNLIYNMKCNRGEVMLRIGTLYRNSDKLELENLSENKRKISSQSSSSTESPAKRPRTYMELAQTLKELSKFESTEDQNLVDLLFACDGVKLYYIESGGDVISSLEDFVLRIVRIGCDAEKNLEETLFLQVIKSTENCVDIGVEVSDEPAKEDGEASGFTKVEEESDFEEVNQDASFIYPLVPGVSPCFRTDYGAFVLPDLQSNDGSAIGLIIGPPAADEIVLEILITLLHGVVKENGTVEFGDQMKAGETALSRPRRSVSDSVSSNIVSGAYYISAGLVKSAEKAGQFIDYSTPYIMSKMNKAPLDAPPVSSNLHTTVTVAKSLTGYAAKGTSFVAEKVGGATMALGRFLAPHVQQQGSKLLTYTFGIENTKAQEHMTDGLKIASGAVEGFSTIYSGLESSAGILGRNLSGNTVKVVEHKYGSSAGLMASDTLDTVGNLINVNRNFSYMTPRGLVKSTAKNTGKGILFTDEFKPKVYLNKDYLTGNTKLYPNLSNLAKELNKPKFA
ncbi:unnamed protein product [Diamesa tonsa]